MEASKSLRRPANWQDFETLCKKLWGEIWNCPEIKKNGRAGQDQNGVDVYGIPFGEDAYFGIQCKGKDEYTNKQFTETEIDKEIKLARAFDPPLKKLYFATTAVKDASIEAYIRNKNIENKAAGSFEIHIFSWEDIVDMIDENRHTHDWYLKSQNFKTSKSVLVTFHDSTTELSAIPQFKKETTHYRQKIVPAHPVYPEALNNIISVNKMMQGLAYPVASTTEVNLSYFSFALRIQNTGDSPIEEFKLFFEIEEDIQDMADTNENHTGLAVISKSFFRSDLILSNDSNAGKVLPETKILVGDDSYTSDEVYIKPLAEKHDLKIKWKLISKDLKDEGVLKVLVCPDIQYLNKTVLVEDPLQVRINVGDLEDMIINKDN
ncbi:hypothetical protein HYN59_14815 [Flavobacterium album]|uniref:Mrr-like domain-containing protein n=1 Tax=Flavobacterium album TaxID=2175091 RepID=A0A2S1R185_9FLAO|nr:hypothetical protein [Flavobacterium album]AWH86301.1 hypothetical protein HYN59_14815 [Flavobacterium album]